MTRRSRLSGVLAAALLAGLSVGVSAQVTTAPSAPVVVVPSLPTSCPSGYNLACVLETWTTPASNVGTTNTVIATYTLPANTLSADGQSILLEAGVVGAADTTNKSVQALFGTAISGGNSSATSGAVWSLRYLITRIDSGTVAVKGHVVVGVNNTSSAPFPEVETLSVDLTADVVIAIKGYAPVGGVNGDITFSSGKVQWLPAGGLN